MFSVAILAYVAVRSPSWCFYFQVDTSPPEHEPAGTMGEDQDDHSKAGSIEAWHSLLET